MKHSVFPIILAAAAVTLTASTPVYWQVSTQAEFLRGEVDALSVDAEGRLRLGPAAEIVLETPEPSLWSIARASDGAVWAGSGTDGRLYRVGPDDAGAVVFDAGELDVHALAADREGGVFAGTSPAGRVYHVTAGGEVTVVVDPEETYVWALALAGDGALYVATGNPARIYRVPAGGDRELVYESDATHVLALAVAAGGTLLAGTESPGRVLRIDPTGRAFVLLDAPYEEIRSLRPQPDGSLLAVAVSGQPAPPAAPASPPPAAAAPVPTVSVTTSVTAVVVGGNATPAAPQTSTIAPANTGRKGAVYHITADGLWDRLWQSSLDTPFDAAFDERGALVVGTGPNGKLYRVSRNPPRTVLSGQAPARQVTRLLPEPDGSIAYATANPGKIMRMASSLAARGTYESEVHDAAAAARWGTIRWRGATPGGSRIELATRSGNTAIPNATWSAWSAAHTDASGAPITSPNARYLQWRATLHRGDASPVLTSVTAAYLPRNRRPEITQLTVHPPGTAFHESFSSSDPPIAGLDERSSPRPATASTVGRETYRKGIQTFRWQASDENRDPLDYAVSYQRAGGTEWHVLRTGLRDTVFAWDTTTVPDGAYRVKITASDARGNAPGAALTGERDSLVFDIDNAAPRIEVAARRREGNRVVLPFTVRDAQSPVQRVEITTGNDRWQVVYPLDGVPDGLVERFEVVLDAAGDAPIIIRATDALRNTVSVFGE